jgi:hypothetical protein
VACAETVFVHSAARDMASRALYAPDVGHRDVPLLRYVGVFHPPRTGEFLIAVFLLHRNRD